MKKSHHYTKTLVLMVISITTIFPVAGCTKHTSIERTYSYEEAVTYTSKNGIIENQQKWQHALNKSNQGKNIHTLQELNTLLYQGNKHASAMSSAKSYDNLNYPTTTSYGKLKVINVPTFGSEKAKNSKNYSRILTKQLTTQAHKNTIILNFANNRGGDPQAMIAGVSQLLPNGILFKEVSKTGRKYNFVKTAHTITDQRSHETTQLPAASTLAAKKIYVIVNFQTASAAEFTTIALKQNPKTVIVGYPTGGYTTTNKLIKLSHKKEVANITNGTVISPRAIHGRTHFNNNPIQPDIASLYEPIPSLNNRPTTATQKLDPDFIEELQQLVD